MVYSPDMVPAYRTADYDEYTHDELYTMLMAGDPGQVDALTAKWDKIMYGLGDIASNLSTELTTLGGDWNSASGREFQRRIGLVAEFSDTLSDCTGRFVGQLGAMGGELRRSQQQSEPPDKTPHSVAAAAVVAGPLAASAGYQKDQKAKRAAKNRMAALVKSAAYEYQPLAANPGGYEPTAPDADLPGGVTQQGLNHVSGNNGYTSGPVTVSTAHGTDGHHNKTGTFAVSAPVTPGHGTATGTHAGTVTTGGVSGPGHTGSEVTRLAGAGGGGISAVSPVGPPGSGAEVGLPNLAGATAGAGTAGVPLATAITAPPMTSLAAAEPVEGHSGTIGRPPAAAEEPGVAGRSGVLAGSAAEDEADERTTWLTEDDMVWGGDVPAAPGVIVAPAETREG